MEAAGRAGSVGLWRLLAGLAVWNYGGCWRDCHCGATEAAGWAGSVQCGATETAGGAGSVGLWRLLAGLAVWGYRGCWWGWQCRATAAAEEPLMQGFRGFCPTWWREGKFNMFVIRPYVHANSWSRTDKKSRHATDFASVLTGVVVHPDSILGALSKVSIHCTGCCRVAGYATSTRFRTWN